MYKVSFNIFRFIFIVVEEKVLQNECVSVLGIIVNRCIKFQFFFK